MSTFGGNADSDQPLAHQSRFMSTRPKNHSEPIAAGAALSPCLTEPHNYFSRMAEDNWESRGVCNHPKVEIDAWGQRLHGCIQCNQWMNFDGEWLRLPQQDIAALRGLDWQRSNSLESREYTKRAPR